MPKKLPKRPGGASDFKQDGPITEMGQHQVKLKSVTVWAPQWAWPSATMAIYSDSEPAGGSATMAGMVLRTGWRAAEKP